VVGKVSGSDIWIYDARRDVMTPLTFGGGLYQSPTWSPDGSYVIFTSLTDGMFWVRADGAGQPQPLLTSKNGGISSSFSPDGKLLAYNDALGNDSSIGQIWTVPIEDSGGRLKSGKPEQFLKTQFDNCCAMFSPEGQWLAYESNESGKNEVYVQAYMLASSGQGRKWQISNSGGQLPVWSRKTRELFYQSGDQILAVKYTVKGAVFAPEKPRVWATKLAGAIQAGGAQWFDLAPDGNRLAVEVPVGKPEPPKPQHEVTLVFNFSDELRRRAAVAK
jgi:Tol biopolymer transport system component